MAETGKDESCPAGVEVKVWFNGAEDDLDFPISQTMLQQTVNQVKETVLKMPQLAEIGTPHNDIAMVLSWGNGQRRMMSDSAPMTAYQMDFQTCEKIIFMNRNEAQNHPPDMKDMEACINSKS